MNMFENVTVLKKANVYFDGKVTSRTVIFPDGTKKTLGIILPGEYSFSTAEEEIMEVISGSLKALLPKKDTWQTFFVNRLRYQQTAALTCKPTALSIIAVHTTNNQPYIITTFEYWHLLAGAINMQFFRCASVRINKSCCIYDNIPII